MICLLGVVYVHAWTGLAGSELAASDSTWQGTLRWMLMEMFGRSSVPLLSAISGWLAVGSLQRRGYRSLLLGKARTLIVPMILWNAIAVVLVSGAACAGLIKAPTPQSWSWLINELLCLFRPDDINVQMSFLRDLFVCMTAAPLLIRLPSWALVLVCALSAAWAVSGLHLIVLFRPPILMFFSIGLLARRRDLHVRLGRQSLTRLAVPYLAAAFASAWIGADGAAWGLPGWVGASADLLLRLTAAAFFWSLACRLARSALAEPLLRLEPYAFLMFCVHLIIIWLAGPLIGRFTGPLGSPLYPLFLLLQPPLVMWAAVVIGRSMAAASPAAALVLSGGRLDFPRPAQTGVVVAKGNP